MKKIKFNLRTVLALLIGVSIIGLTACGGAGQKEGEEKAAEEKGEISILYPNWAEGIAFTNLAKVMLEDEGYDVTITPLEPGPIYATLAKGDADLFFDAWLPHTHSDYWEKYGDKLVKLGESFSNGTTGLVVPQYVEINSIPELNDVAKKFDNEIIGIGSGAGIHRNTEKAIKEYNLDLEQVTSSGPAMVASLRKAYNSREPIVITGWKPHHKWANFDLKYLEDPKGVYPKDVCAILSRKGFENDFPTVAKMCANFNLKETQLYDLMGKIKESDQDAEVVAKEWYNNHKVLVESWWPGE
ncbi:MAG: glycine betaine ABC transporter substrate-binding protein [Bacteroidales bacterium]|nr:glycine betaine ABC transporter substrate-binding protein [Bacteroidales bacterium]